MIKKKISMQPKTKKRAPVERETKTKKSAHI
jgi:hypothetical protein